MLATKTTHIKKSKKITLLPKFGYNPDMKVKKSSSLLHIFGYMLETQ
jgi:hypothetical protein